MAISSPVCAICDLRHISQRSVVWCPECNESLCGDCKEYYSLSKLSRYHIVMSVSDYEKLPSDVLQISQACNNHNEQFQMYCKKPTLRVAEDAYPKLTIVAKKYFPSKISYKNTARSRN